MKLLLKKEDLEVIANEVRVMVMSIDWSGSFDRFEREMQASHGHSDKIVVRDKSDGHMLHHVSRHRKG